MLMMLMLLIITIRLFLTYYEQCCPVTKIYLNDDEDNPWMTTRLNNVCKKKKHIKFLQNKMEVDEKDTNCIKIILQLF